MISISIGILFINFHPFWYQLFIISWDISSYPFIVYLHHLCFNSFEFLFDNVKGGENLIDNIYENIWVMNMRRAMIQKGKYMHVGWHCQSYLACLSPDFDVSWSFYCCQKGEKMLMSSYIEFYCCMIIIFEDIVCQQQKGGDC